MRRRRIIDNSAVGLSAGIVFAIVFWGLIAFVALVVL